MTAQPLAAMASPVFTGAVAAARAGVDRAAGVGLGLLSAWEVEQGLAEVTALESQVAALRLELLAEADTRKLAEQTAAADTSAWAAKLTGSTRARMAGGLLLARLLQETYHHTRAAFAAGTISEAQVRVIVRAAEQLPPQVTPEQRAEAEQGLVGHAVAGTDPKRLRRKARRMLEKIDKELADKHEADQLEREEKRAEAETWLTLHDNGDGTFSGRFVIPELHGHLLRNWLEQITAPRRLGRNEAGDPVADPTVPGETLNWSESLGLGFCELLEHLPTGFGRTGATLLVAIELQHLHDGLGAARLDTGAVCSAGEARRLSCNAGIIPVVLGGRSQPLDVGRKRRLATEAIRMALSLLHDTCAAEGCERPFAWCEIHHPHAWADGGVTSLANSLPLCGWHHRRVHDDAYRVTYLPTREVRFKRRM